MAHAPRGEHHNTPPEILWGEAQIERGKLEVPLRAEPVKQADEKPAGTVIPRLRAAPAASASLSEVEGRNLTSAFLSERDSSPAMAGSE